MCNEFTSITHTPMICDGDTGYGGLLNVMHTVRGYEAAGACAIQLEDQEFPKKCGHTPGRRVIPMEDMVRKIRIGLALQPLASAMFANSPFVEGKPSGFLSYRSQVWTDTDNHRSGIPAVFFIAMGGFIVKVRRRSN